VIVMESRPTPDHAAAHENATTLAEDLPELYRAILDRVAELERVGFRREAGRIRLSATRAYSDAWDETARRHLLGLLARSQRELAVRERPRGWTLRRRSVAAR
jgi:hypothetical protein